MDRIKVASVNMEGGFDKNSNIQKLVKIIECAANEGVKLLVTPEQYVHGYLDNLAGPLTGEIIYHHRHNAELIPEGESVKIIAETAQKHQIYVVFGMTERDKITDSIIYNTAVLVGPEGYIGKYRKVHQPVDEKHIFTAGTDLPVFDTQIGKIGIGLCVDKYFPETVREMALKGAEIVCFLCAWEGYVGEKPEHAGYILGDKFDVLDSVRAMENQIWIITSNRVGLTNGGQYYGHSKIVDPDGYILSECGVEEELCYADINVKEEITVVHARVCVTMLHERTPRAYKALSAETGYPATSSL